MANDTANFGFQFHGQPIKPQCLAIFNQSMVNLPAVRSINLNACTHNQNHSQTIHHDHLGGYAYFNNNKNEDDGYYRYAVVGKTPDGIYVVHTFNDGGGSSVFDEVLLMRLQNTTNTVFEKTAHPNQMKILSLNLVGQIMGGDRCAGGIRHVKINKDTLDITQYTGKNAADCQTSKHYTIPLTLLKQS